MSVAGSSALGDLDHGARVMLMVGCQEQTVSMWGGMERHGARFDHAALNGTQLKTDELFISGIFYLIFLDHR